MHVMTLKLWDSSVCDGIANAVKRFHDLNHFVTWGERVWVMGVGWWVQSSPCDYGSKIQV